MPKKFKTTTKAKAKKPYKKKGYKKRTSKMLNKVSTLCLPKGIDQMFPDRLCVKLKNVFQIVWTGTAGANNGFASAGNNFYNGLSGGALSGAVPWSTGTAAQIYGLSRILSTSIAASTGPYNQYRIISSALKVQTANTSAGPADSSTLLIVPVANNGITGLGNINVANELSMGEMPYAKFNVISGTTVNKSVTQYHKMSTARMYALKYKSSLEDPIYTGTEGSNVTNSWFWIFGWFPQTTASTTATSIVTQEFYVEFFNRNNLPTGTG